MKEEFGGQIKIPQGFERVRNGKLIQTGDYCINHAEVKPFYLKLTWSRINLRPEEVWTVKPYDLIIRKKELIKELEGAV